MSASRLKKQIQCMREHLGSDQRGVELLVSIKELADGVRKEFSRERLKREDANKKNQTFGESCAELKSEVYSLKSEVQSLRSRLAQSESRASGLASGLSDAEKQIRSLKGESELGSKSDGNIYDPERILGLCRFLRKRQKYAPSPSLQVALSRPTERTWLGGGSAQRAKIQCYDIETVVKDLSHESIFELGCFVAVLAMFNLPCIVRSNKVLSGNGEDSDIKIGVDEGRYGKFLGWFSKNNIEKCPPPPHPQSGKVFTK